MDEEVEVSPEGLPMMEEETKYTSERINVLEEELQKERELRKDLEDRNGKLRFTIAELQKELTSWKEGKGGVDVAIQTSEEEATGLNSSIGDTRIPEKIDKDHPVPDEAHSIADSLRDAAEAAMTHSGFVYDENSGLYYDYSSGYYYNPENHLYYDTKTGIYYYFNETSNAYEFHSQVEMPDQSQTWQQETEETEGKNYNRRKKYRENRRKDVKEKYRHKNEIDNLTNRVSDLHLGSRYGCQPSTKTTYNIVNRREYPPCIRMIVTKSESIPPGSLYIITCMGGSIGREGSEHAVVIPETGVSKRHADIYYSQESWQYFIRDLGSQNGTLINSKSLSQPRTESESHSLSHKDYLTIGGTVLRLHIHPGAETCDDCEPGQVQALLAQNQPKASVTISADKEQQRRKGLKEIRKKYGLAKDNYVEKNPSTCNPLYKDRAEGRRKTVGSDNPHQKDDAPSSVDREIASDNLGRKMMEKMGWKSGDTLGKDNTGIKEPINVLSNNKRAGLGGQAQRTISDLAQGSLASEKWDKARARYDAIAGGAKTEIDQEKIMEIGKGSAQSKVKSIQMNWTSGGIMKPQIKKENIFGIDEEEEEEAEDGPVS
ncbi:angiogenic factor with G patch and FHA domains 1-like isoform X2 [Anneissia japonica]|uniref:angiogenic factor with G patch and FHA domains 1-like isoform X2 n=1 Tax=Anneissia japonica TaxID=1529436 RepID=UPI001425ACDC|nr:angiogenic factor with G patch and FHA domains 1-like isoform X2 [Anneissia japonica]